MIPQDKIIHIAKGAGAALLCLAVIEISKRGSVGLAIFFGAAVAAIAYEVSQKIRHEGIFDPMDVAADVIGALLVVTMVSQPWAR